MIGSNQRTLISWLTSACRGLDMTPEQFSSILNDAGKRKIVDGKISHGELQCNAIAINGIIKERVVDSIFNKIVYAVSEI